MDAKLVCQTVGVALTICLVDRLGIVLKW
jgi:hypothetical protein